MNKEQKNTDFEIQFYEGIIKKRGDFVEALMALGDLYTKQGCYKKGLDIDLRLSRLRSDDPHVFYNLACSYSLLDCIDDALSSIKQAIRIGYDDFDFLEKDDDLIKLRQDERFKKYYAKVKKKNRRQ